MHFVTTNSEVGAINTVENDGAANEDFIVPVNKRNDLVRQVQGGLTDLVLGPFIANYFVSPGVRQRDQSPADPEPAAHHDEPAGTDHRRTPLPGAAPSSPCTPPLPPNVQPIGNFLFIANEEKNVVHVFNSNTYQLYKDIPAPDPRRLAIDPLLQFMFVSNFGGNSISVFDITADPVTSLPRGQLVRTIVTGQGPDALVVGPDNEDLFVVNRQENSISVIQLNQIASNEPIRLQLTGNIGPNCIDVCATSAHRSRCRRRSRRSRTTRTSRIRGRTRCRCSSRGRNRSTATAVTTSCRCSASSRVRQSLNADERCGGVGSGSHDPIAPSSSLTGFWVTCRDGTAHYLRANRFRYSPFPNPPPTFVGVDFETTTVVTTGDSPRDIVLRDPYVVRATATTTSTCRTS